MFEFQKLAIYQKAKRFDKEVKQLIKTNSLDKFQIDQLSRASFSIVLNIAEGSGRFTKADRRNFFVISRSSVFECVAVLDVLRDEERITQIQYSSLENLADELSRILYSMIKNLS